MPFEITIDPAHPLKTGLNEGANVMWTEGVTPMTPLEHARVYEANDRVAALVIGAEDGGSPRSIYGAHSKQEIVTRDGQRFVEAIKMVKDQLETIAGTKSGLNLAGLRLDKRALLGEPDAQSDMDFSGVNWGCHLLGDLEINTIDDRLSLRPTLVQYTNEAGSWQTLTFIEKAPGSNVKGDVSHELNVELQPLKHRDANRWNATKLKSSGAFLFDVLQDGGWESPSPLWMKTTQGCLRMERPEGQVRYGVLRESRSLDVTQWFHEPTDQPGQASISRLPPGSRIRLLLDHSGDVTLTVRKKTTGGGPPTITLKVQAPALVILLEAVSAHPSNMVDPLQPPSAAMISNGPLLHVVSTPLFDAPSSGDFQVLRWDIAIVGGNSDKPKRIEFSTTGGDRSKNNFRHFHPHGNWVLPPEAAINGASSEMSSLRVLLPHLQDSDHVTRLLLTERGVQCTSGFSKSLDSALATEKGPLARYTVPEIVNEASKVVADEELAMAAVEGEEVTFEGQPAVLRPGYRTHPDEQEARAPFSATYVHVQTGAPLEPFKEALAEYNMDMVKGHTVMALRHDGDATAFPEMRRDASPLGLGDSKRGWWDSRRFLPGAAPSAWVELQKKDDKWAVRHWLRLSDASLAVVDGDPPIIDAAAVELPAVPVAPAATLPTLLLDDQGRGLGHIVIKETITAGVSSFSLNIGGTIIPANEIVEPAAPVVVGRLVIAFADIGDGPVGIEPEIELADGVKVNKLNRLFLEMERKGEGFKVRRGMLGWNATKVFGLTTVGAFHVTEYYDYDRASDHLSRRVDFSGQATIADGISTDPDRDRADLTVRYDGSVYFWESMLLDSEGPRFLRVMCVHEMQCGGVNRNPSPVCAVQDALVKNNRLDLSADIILLWATDGERPEGADAPDAWKPWRRSLFSVSIDPNNDQLAPVAFLQIRHTDDDSGSIFNFTPDPQQIGVNYKAITLHPDWELCNSAITAWFSDESIIRRDRTTWLAPSAQLLRSASTGVSPKNLKVHLFFSDGNVPLKDRPLRACTLVAEMNQALGEPIRGIPQWIPSPILKVSKAGAPLAAAPDRQCSVWVFDPWPRVVAQWKGTTPPDERKRASKALARINWTREAVLEVSEGDKSTWRVIDSPLLNRDAGINWFGWPLVDGAFNPDDGPLPLTQQIVHVPKGSQPRQSVQVVFEHEVKAGRFRLPVVYRSEMPPPDASVSDPFHKVEFRARGLRAGVAHNVVTYGAAIPNVLQVVAVPLSVDASPTQDLKLTKDQSAGSVTCTWGKDVVSLSDVSWVFNAEAAPYLELFIPAVDAPWEWVIFLKMPAGLQVRTDTAQPWENVVKGAPIGITGTTLHVRLPVGLWSSIEIVLQRTTEKEGKEEEGFVKGSKVVTVVASSMLSYFVDASGAQGIAGLFMDGRLVAFGDEPVRFEPPANAESKSWTRLCQLKIDGLPAEEFDGLNTCHVATMSPFGVITRHIS